MYSSATTSSSASGFSGGGLFVFEGFGVGEVEDAGEAEGDSVGVGFGLRFEGFSEAAGEGEASWSGFTGPVGFRGGAGFAVGVGGWIATILLALMIALILSAAGVIPKNPQPSPMIGWMAALPLWKKGTIVFSAMTVEEAFFRGWLQKRVGLIFSTLLFALAHSGLGQPLLLIGVAIISLIIGFTFYRTKNLIPGIIAHGVFDGVQLFVIIPIVFKMAGLGG